MNSLVFVVEDCPDTKDLIARYFERDGISFIFASDQNEAIELFKRNEKQITHIALDGNLTGGGHLTGGGRSLDTLHLAKVIAASEHFEGAVFLMSSNADHNKILMDVLGGKGHIPEFQKHVKLDTANEIIRRIRHKRNKNQ